MTLNYSVLVKDYYDNLHTNLRKFRGGPGFLETWVLDSDHNRSILGLLDAAIDAKVPTLTLELENTVLADLNIDSIGSEIKKYGNVKLVKTASGGILEFHSAHSQELDSLNPAYQQAVNTRMKSISNEGALEGAPGEVLVQAEQDGIRLLCAIDPKGLVRKARHKGATGSLRVVLDQLCEELVDRPLQEGADHAVIRVENALRNSEKSPPVQGLVTPLNANPIFKTPTALVRKIYYNWLNETKSTEERNRWEDPLPENWLSLPLNVRILKARDAMSAALKALNIPDSKIEVVDIKTEKRLVLAFTQPDERNQIGNQLIKLERMISDTLQVAIELQLESLDDRNLRVKRTKRNN